MLALLLIFFSTGHCVKRTSGKHEGSHAADKLPIHVNDKIMEIINIIPMSGFAGIPRNMTGIYRIAGNFGGELNLAVWQSILQPPN